MKNTLFLLLAALAAGPASAVEFYVEPRISAVDLAGTPSVGDLGNTQQSDYPDTAFTAVIGARLSPALALELRYTPLGDFTIHKAAPTSHIFPGSGVSLPVVTPYDYYQSTDVFTVALPVRVAGGEKWSATLAPLLLVERTSVDLYLVGVYYITVPGPIWSRDRTTVRPGVEATASVRLGSAADLTFGYTFMALETMDAHLLNAGLRFRF